jgi:PKD domain-containing protein
LKRLEAGFLFLALTIASPGCEELPPAPDLPNELPTAAFFFSPVAPINAGQTGVDFNAIGSKDLDGTIVSYIWDFGDGTTPQTTDVPTIRHTFPDTSARCMLITYGVSLIVVDDKGGRGVASQGVTVTELPPPTALECQPAR